MRKDIFLSRLDQDFMSEKLISLTNSEHKTQFITNKNKAKIMTLLHSTRKFFKFFDLFSTSQFLRFQQDSEYKTASGGICSLIVIGIFMALFMSTAIQTINMQIITWSSTSQLLFDPSQTIIPINPPTSPFMFAIKMLGMNLNDNVRYFDITMVQRQYINGMYENTPKYVEMVPCTTQHFGLTEEIKKNTANLGINTWLCPPIGYNFSVKGKFTSADMKLLEVRVTKCSIKSLVYSIVHKLHIDDFVSVLKEIPKDFEYYCFLKDQSKHKIDEYETVDCKECRSKHTYFDCPLYHCMPIKSEICI